MGTGKKHRPRWKYGEALPTNRLTCMYLGYKQTDVTKCIQG